MSRFVCIACGGDCQEMESVPISTEGFAFAARQFDGGAMRDSEDGKYDFEGFLSPQVLVEFAAYMHKNRFLKDGRVRDSDNWQGGMPRDVYMKSMLRHLMDLWLLHRGHPAVRPETGEQVSLGDTLGGLLFNLQGYWLQVIRVDDEVDALLKHADEIRL